MSADPSGPRGTRDPFATRRLRDAVLSTWTRSPLRLREDANAEEDHARGWYRDRVVVELAQNAADAAVRTGVRARLSLDLHETADGVVLVARNTGAPLDPAGVAALASLRASAKRDQSRTVGRFGVGFAAVRSVADEVAVVSTTGAVHFSLARTAAALADLVRGPAGDVGADGVGVDAGDAADVEPDDGTAALAEEVARRGAWLPVLRLPFEGPGPLGDVVGGPGDLGADATAVVLRLRDAAAVASVRAQLDAVDDVLLLALPALAQVTVCTAAGERTVAHVPDRWVVARRGGTLDAALLAGRAVEEQQRTGWQITWAVRRDGGRPPGVVHAPTPTDDVCSVPALLVGTFPLDPSRRHVAAGPLTDALVQHAGEAWGDLLTALRRDGGPDPLDLAPAGLPSGRVDAALCEAVLAATRRAPVLPSASGGPPLVPTDALVLSGRAGEDRRLLAVLARHRPALVDVGPAHRRTALRLGATEVDLAELVDGLPADPATTRAVLDAAGAAASVLEQLAALPVRLADGRVVRGARGLLVATGVPDDVVRALAGWGVRLVDPAAAHPSLERLGARAADADALLRDPAVRERVLGDGDRDGDDRDDDDGDDDAVGGGRRGGGDGRGGEHGGGPGDTDPDAGRAAADAPAPRAADVVLALAAAAAATAPGRAPEPWWGDVLLPAADGELLPARDLVVPGSDAERWFADDVVLPVDPALVATGRPALERLGVRSGPVLLAVPVDADEAEPLDGWPDYLDLLSDLAGTDVEDLDLDPLLAVTDLDAVRDDVWPEVLDHLARGDTRDALVTPVRLPLTGGGVAEAPSYAAWWLRRRSGLPLPAAFALDRAGALTREVLPPVPDALAGLDDAVLRALGGVGNLASLDLAAWDAVLAPLDDGAPVAATVGLHVWRALTHALGATAPERVPALGPDGVRLEPLDDVAAADPMWAQRCGDPAVGPCVVVPADLAERVADELDVELAADRAAGTVTSSGVVVAVPEAAARLVDGLPTTYVEHDDLRVDGYAVDWWLVGGEVHAATTRGLADGLAAVAGWSERHALARALEGEPALRVLVDRAGEPHG